MSSQSTVHELKYFRWQEDKENIFYLMFNTGYDASSGDKWMLLPDYSKNKMQNV